MIRVAIVLLAGGLLAAPAYASTDALSDLLRGKAAEAPRRCIFPDRAVQPQIIEGTALVYRDARYTYVARFKSGCPALREGRRIATRGTGGQLCENDPVHVTEATGADFGFCTFDRFTPYRKAR
jgi:hypothetical protein